MLHLPQHRLVTEMSPALLLHAVMVKALWCTFCQYEQALPDIVVSLQKFDEKYPKVGMLAEEETEDQVP